MKRVGGGADARRGDLRSWKSAALQPDPVVRIANLSVLPACARALQQEGWTPKTSMIAQKLVDPSTSTQPTRSTASHWRCYADHFQRWQDRDDKEQEWRDPGVREAETCVVRCPMWPIDFQSKRSVAV